MNEQYLIYALYLAGAGQIFIALIYEWVRCILEWDAGVAAMPSRLNQQIAHTYSRYIQGLNLIFGVTTIVLAPTFFAEPTMGGAFALILALYWGIRTVIALTYYDIGSVIAQRPLFRVGNYFFNFLFALMAIIYALTAWNAWIK